MIDASVKSDFKVPYSPNEIVNFQISNKCIKSLPCRHDCTITFLYDKKITVQVKGTDICSILMNMEKNKITNECTDDHFYFLSAEKYKKRSVNEILNEIQKEYINKIWASQALMTLDSVSS
jgi:hypothetical protein